MEKVWVTLKLICEEIEQMCVQTYNIKIGRLD